MRNRKEAAQNFISTPSTPHSLLLPATDSRITFLSAFRQWAWNRSSSSAARRRNGLRSVAVESAFGLGVARGAERGAEG